jgi:3-oxoadipate enol-lactonase
VKVHYETTGDGDVVVLSNSIGSNLRMWDPQVEPLVNNGFRVVRYDSRGHGKSDVPSGPYSIADLGGDVVELLDTLGVESAHFVGLSLGGMTGAWLGQHAPTRIRTLALTFTSVKPGNADMWTGRARQVRAEGMAAIAEGSIGRWFTQDWIAAHQRLAAELQQMTATTPAEGYASSCEAIAGLDLTAGLSTISAPTLVVSGADDAALPPSHGQVIADGIPGARFEILGHAAHLGSYEQAEQFTGLLLDHLKGTR